MQRDALERRAVEFRVADGGTGLAVLTGTAMPYGERSRIGPFTEEFRAGSLKADDVIANVMHRRDRPLARQGSGLVLTDGPSALEIRLALPDTADGRDTLELVRSGVLQGLSVEFRAIKEAWEGKHRIIHSAALTGVAVVDRSAYAGATLHEGRSMQSSHWLALKAPRGTRRWRSL